MMNEVDIFQYDNSTLFLRESWEKKRGFNKNFTLRAWAKQLGISSYGTLHQMIKGMRPFPKKYAIALGESLNLGAKEVLYFETLIDYERSKTLKEKEHFANRLKELAPGEKITTYEVNSFQYLKDPLNGAIIEMTSLKDFNSDPIWIKERLAINASVNEIKEALRILNELEFLKFDENGKLKRQHIKIRSTKDVKSQALREYHKNIMRHASDALETQDVLEREYNAVAFGVKKSSIPEIKENIRKYINDLVQEHEAIDGEAEDIYQLSNQFYKLTNDTKGKLQ
ncbi:MAG: TIGR02147 family protein [Bacteriovoracaceae bacterium]|nr:TIGR02147 family protein [Bacteriovoracaceae bacterium]